MPSQDFLETWTSILRTNPQILIAIATGIWLLVIWSLRLRFTEIRKSKTTTCLPAAGFPPVAPLSGFDWRTTEPEKCRPFVGKARFHLTMALESLDPSELIPIDKTYKDRLALRASLLKTHPDTVVGVDDPSDSRTRAAVSEYYTFILGTYLPGRYPGLFTLHPTELSDGRKTHMLENHATGELWPVAMPAATRRGLETLARVIDEDVLFLLPDPDRACSPADADGEKYTLTAYATCFPSGFDTRQKLGRRLAHIHAPVPGYAEKLERSMDRFFSRMEVGRYVKRVNWSVTTGTELFAAFGGVHGEEGDGMRGLELAELDLDSTVLRCERQTLHRLPGCGAMVFAFHTYTYPIKEVKEDGLGEELAKAIDGLRDGSAPQMHVYKRGPVWGEAVKEYLRS